MENDVFASGIGEEISYSQIMFDTQLVENNLEYQKPFSVEDIFEDHEKGRIFVFFTIFFMDKIDFTDHERIILMKIVDQVIEYLFFAMAFSDNVETLT
ncbi:MAG: hypothetical protein KAH18_04715 [Psychromonas sp.]|nr:hypothetical protein [Psychromonas sp.]